MEQILRITLPLYFIIYFGLAFVAKTILVAKKIGKNPIVLQKDDTVYGLIGQYFKLIMLGMSIYVFLFAFFPALYEYFLPIHQLDKKVFKYIGAGLMLFALVWTIIAQTHMKNSWRIGIDTETKTELVTGGLFRFSRNPIFFGMIISLLGIMLATPNAVTI